MLTLFKPWRSGKDLKTESETWDEGFTTYVFSKHQQQVMKYFNLWYECLDDVMTILQKGIIQKNKEFFHNGQRLKC